MAESWVHALLICALAPCVLTLFSRTGSEPSQRNISITLNPGHSDPPPPGGDLLYVRSVGPNDSLHFLFCSQGAPTLLLVHSNSTEATVKVNWDDFLNRSSSGTVNVVPEGSVVYSGALIFSKVWEYDDVNDTADPGSDLFPPYELQDMTWSRLNLSTLSAQLCGVYKDTNGTICVQLSVFEDWGRSELWPRLLHNPDSAQLAFRLDGLSSRSSQSRFFLELTAVGRAPLEMVRTIRSIDDEFTPSIFTVSQWLFNSSGPGSNLTPGTSPGFVQWKPVAYRKPAATLEVATPLRHWSPQHQDPLPTATASKLIFGFYSNNTPTMGINISFGLSGEPFYDATNYLSWTLLVGVGDPPLDSFSVLVWSILAVGLGTPLLLLLVGGVWLCVRKLSAPAPSSYEPIN